jgi:hypothetical protein
MKGHKKTRLGGQSLIKPHTWSPQFARYCIECAKEDITLHGETYWHRLHQIPDINVCADHYCWLENTGLKLDNRDGIGLMTAGQRINLSRQPKYLSQDGDYEKIQLFLARAAKYFLSVNPSCRLYLEDMHERYKSRFFEMGLLNIRGNLYKGKLWSYIRSKVGPQVLQQLQEALYGFKQIWNTSIVPDRSVAPPTVHFLSMYFLDVEPKYFMETCIAITPFGTGPWPCLNPSCENFNKPVIQTFRLKNNGVNGYGVFTCECGFSYKLKCQDPQKI